MYENKCMIVLFGEHLVFLRLELQTAPSKEQKGSRKKWRSYLRKKFVCFEDVGEDDKKMSNWMMHRSKIHVFLESREDYLRWSAKPNQIIYCKYRIYTRWVPNLEKTLAIRMF